MYDFICRLAVWASTWLTPSPRGRHRGGRPRPAVPAPAVVARGSLPALRSPYGLDTLLDAHAVALVRPYYVAYERAQQRRRRNLVMAAHFGVDLDTRVIHRVEVAR